VHAHTSTANCPLGVLSRCEMPACPLSTPVQPCRSHAPACVSHCGPPAESLPLWPGQACPGMPRVPITLGPAPGIVTAWLEPVWPRSAVYWLMGTRRMPGRAGQARGAGTRPTGMLTAP